MLRELRRLIDEADRKKKGVLATVIIAGSDSNGDYDSFRTTIRDVDELGIAMGDRFFPWHSVREISIG